MLDHLIGFSTESLKELILFYQKEVDKSQTKEEREELMLVHNVICDEYFSRR